MASSAILASVASTRHHALKMNWFGLPLGSKGGRIRVCPRVSRDRLALVGLADERCTARPSSGGFCAESLWPRREDDRNFKRNSVGSGSAISIWGPFGYRGDLGVPLPRAQPPLLRERQQMSVAAARVSLIHSCSLSAALRRPLTRRAPRSLSRDGREIRIQLPPIRYVQQPAQGW